MLARGQAPGHGVFAPEQIDPAPFLDLMTEHSAPWGVVELPADEELPV
jgi:saccharopine dehydrogenase-like NADP-dependent oxidoreductase